MRVKMISRIAIVAALAFAAAGAREAPAQDQRRGPAPAQPSNPTFTPPKGPLNPDEAADAMYHDSGSVGRNALGADPDHPEGPGGTTSDVN